MSSLPEKSMITPPSGAGVMKLSCFSAVIPVIRSSKTRQPKYSGTPSVFISVSFIIVVSFLLTCELLLTNHIFIISLAFCLRVFCKKQKESRNPYPCDFKTPLPWHVVMIHPILYKVKYFLQIFSCFFLKFFNIFCYVYTKFILTRTKTSAILLTLFLIHRLIKHESTVQLHTAACFMADHPCSEQRRSSSAVSSPCRP